MARRPADTPTRDDATIVAPATPGGAGAVSIVRLSGPDAFAVAAKLTSVSPRAVAPRTLVRSEVHGVAGETLDAALLAIFPAPHSFTGEDVVEFHLHGNPVVVESVVRAACAAGAVPADPGEFTRRAFLRGKMDLTQAEGLADLIEARTEQAARAALRQMQGGIRREIGPLRQKILALLAALEAAIDFAEEDDIPGLSAEQAAERVSEIALALGGLLRSFEAGHRFRDGATVAIAGVANVGKSRLLNRLSGEERAIVDEVPGTTRDYLQAEVTISGIPVLLIDTAGLRETADPVEREGVRRSRDVVSRADLTLFILDGSRPAAAADCAAYGDVEGRPHLVVLNKSDLPSLERGETFAGEGSRGALRLSAKTGEGIGELSDRIAAELGPEEGAILALAPLTRVRHRVAVEKAVAALFRAQQSLKEGLPLEFPAADIQEASGALAELVGEVAPEEVLDAIFSRFCVGK